MEGICPSCEKQTELELVKTKEEITVRGKPIEVEVEYYRCLSCGQDFDDPRSNSDPLEKAYSEYYRRHGRLETS